MITLLNLINVIGGVHQTMPFNIWEHHHWLLEVLLFAYLFRFHNRSVHARFSALDKHVDEIRKRLACDLCPLSARFILVFAELNRSDVAGSN
jgi:hypothetical protein